ncbi:sensor histidine kinase [Pseudomonas viridiflava]|uniref:sensor histidine kinase n=1 Tax=Pseudomonas viridiflava TaxID=33069 RepID=UPI000C07AD2F|nr:ATP-binding protein [Pseudomonas viridiflava]PHN61831.1 two-component system sensor protein [Pseudomonas viridiflava]
MKPAKNKSKPLWHWVGLRMSMLAIGAVIAIAFSMWLHFSLVEWEALSRIPPEAAAEFIKLQNDPDLNKARLWQLFIQYIPIENFLPGVADKDWLLLASLVAAAIPIILLCGFLFSRSLSSQFSSIAQMARKVAEGDFKTRLPSNPRAPEEIQSLIADFNSMTTQLERYEQEVRESSAVIAHELRTPLNAAMGRIQGMIEDVFPLEPTQLEMVNKQLNHLNKLVDDLHLLSLARAGQLVLDKTQFSLRSLIQERVTWFSAQLTAAGVVPQITISDELQLSADRDRVGQIVNIIIDNFLRYAAQGKSLEISAHINLKKIMLIFDDRGPGIAAEDSEKVFERFWRAERSRARHSGGSGLGLSIAMAICSAHGGIISVTNRLGGGASMNVEFPL